MTTPQPNYEFGPFRVDSTRRILRRDGELVPIPPKPFDLLMKLIEHRGEMLSKDRLIELLWSGTVGTEANLSVNVATLRKILGERPEDHFYIVTHPQQGYSFVAEVRVCDGADDRHPQPEPAKPIIRHLAVLPFRTVGFAAGSDYLGAGLSDAITSGLTLLRRVAVREMSSTRRSAGAHPHDVRAGQELGVDAVVEGTIRKVAGSLEVTAALVRVVDSAILWQESFTTAAGKLSQLGEQIAEAVRARLEDAPASLAPRALTENTDALRIFMQGRHYQTSLEPNAFEESIALFQQAIALDPSFALAYAAMARSYYSMSWLGTHPEIRWADRIEAAARRALDLDPALADAHACLGLAELGGRYRLEAARTQFEQALTLAPMSTYAQHSYALYFLATSDLDEALLRVRLALSMDPLCIETNHVVGLILMHRREYLKAVRHLQAFSELDGRPTWVGFTLGWCLVLEGDHEAALDIFRGFDADAPWVHAMLAYIYSHMNELGEAEKHIAAWTDAARTRPHSFFWCAIVHLARQELDEATACLERGHAEGEPFIVFLDTDPRWDPIREHPHFKRLVRRVFGPHP